MNYNSKKLDSFLPKKILITGKNSFIGQSLEIWLKQSKYKNRYQVDTVDTINNEWKEMKFYGYDIVFHVAGIAHVDNSKMDDNKKQLYYKVNRDLTIEIAKKAKDEGIGQFIFMSSSIVFGDNGKLGINNRITRNTSPSPTSIYGDSKLQADLRIHELQSDLFHVVSLRPPMIYGKGCKGNYPLLSKYARKIPLFPDIRNERSMLHVDNLCECIRLIIDNDESGYFYPQNKEYVSTSLLVKEIAEVHGKSMFLTKIFNPLLYLLSKRVMIINKVFGSFAYDKKMSNYKNYAYCVNDVKVSVEKTEL
jgi:UDP-glucose 4-epimerase